MSRLKFEITYNDPDSKARLGRLTTANGGKVDTPAFVPVGTQATVKTLSSRDLEDLNVEIIISNTYHLHLRPGEALVDEMGGLHDFMNWRGIIMTDSGGFQVFSLGASIEHGVGKVASIFPDEDGEEKVITRNKKGDPLVKLTEKGAQFRSHIDGSLRELTPESVVDIQRKLNSDIMLVLDECTSPLHDFEYTARALERTHRWAARALTHYIKSGSDQAIFGIIQGGAWEDLRVKSATQIGGMPFDGFAIGGSLGRSKQDMYDILKWIEPILPPDRPRHLLGIGDMADIFEIVPYGVDTFDCVLPTRYARHKMALVKGKPNFRLKLANAIFKDDPQPLEPGCECPTCDRGYTRSYIHHLFKAGETLAGHLVTIHNIHFMMNLMKIIREAIAGSRYNEVKEEWLSGADLL
jgi:queuine tRNA-ribosyltransferase